MILDGGLLFSGLTSFFWLAYAVFSLATSSWWLRAGCMNVT